MIQFEWMKGITFIPLNMPEIPYVMKSRVGTMLLVDVAKGRTYPMPGAHLYSTCVQ